MRIGRSGDRRRRRLGVIDDMEDTAFVEEAGSSEEGKGVSLGGGGAREVAGWMLRR